MRTLLTVLLIMVIAGASAQTGIDNPNESTPVTLFFHLDAIQDFPINTQPPDDRYARADSLGPLAATTSCIEDPSGQFGVLSQSFHTFYGFSTPGYVEYDFQEEGGPRIHPERGLASDVLLDGSADATLFWYLETKTTGDLSGNDDIENLPIVVPNVQVVATIREGDDVSIGGAAYNSGSIIAEGVSDAKIMRPDASTPGYIAQPDGSHLYEFQVPITLATNTIRAEEAFNVRIDIRMEIPGCTDDLESAFMPAAVNVHTSPDYRPRLEWSIMNPVSIEYIHPQFIGDNLVVHTAFSSPWGNYDVDESLDGITVEIQGPSEARSLTRTAFVQRHHEHNHHFEPVDVSYSWPFKLDNAARGDYMIEVNVLNDQRTGQATGWASFEIGRNVAVDAEGNEVAPVEQESQDSPTGIIVVLGLALVAVAARRR